MKLNKKTILYLKELPLTPENIELICGCFNLDFRFFVNGIIIKTPFSVWRVLINNDKNLVSGVYHQNYKSGSLNSYGKNSKMRGFHKQKTDSNNFFDVIQYIYYHDKDFMKLRMKKTRIELLFDQIENDKKKKEVTV